MQTITKPLPNGLRLAVNSFAELETVGISFRVNFGSIDEKPSINGSAHFLEHMLFKGTKKRTWKQINDQLKEIGAQNNAFTDHESTIYFVKVYKGHFEKAMEIISDMVKNSTIPEKEFELERGPIINENLIRHDNPKFQILDYMPAVLFKKHPARMSVGGDNEKTIKGINREDLLGIYNKNYNTQNSVLSIYGGISNEEATKSAIKYFGDFDKPYVKQNRFISKEKQAATQKTIARKGIKQTRIGVGFICGEFQKSNPEEFVSLLVSERYLDDKLFEEVREKRGLSYDPMATYEPYSTFGFIAAAAGVEPKNFDETKKIILKEFENLQNGEIGKPDFERTKKTLSIEYKVRREDTISMSLSASVYELTYSGTKLLDSLPDLITKVSLDDVRKYCSKYINVDKAGVLILKPS